MQGGGSVTSSDHVKDLKDMLKGKKETEDEEAKELPEADRNLLDEEIKVLEKKLKETENQVQEEKDRYVRLLAEFENFRKRMEKEQKESIKFGTDKLLKELFPIIDHLEMTIHHTSKSTNGGKNEADEEMTARERAIVEGVELILKQFEQALEKFGLRKVTGEGTPFNPHIQEAIGQVTTEKYKPGIVVEVNRSGYMLHDRVVRPALVTVAAEPAKDDSSETTQKKKVH